MIPTSLRRALGHKSNPYVDDNPYRAKKLWPPDFQKLTTKHQFRFERRYKKRMRLKFERPGWIKGIKLAQFGIMTLLFGYSVLFIDWRQPNQPFQGVRRWFNNTTGTEWAPTDEILQRRKCQLEDTSPTSDVEE